MQKIFLLSVTALSLFVQCNKAPLIVDKRGDADVTATAPTAANLPLITANASPHFMQVAEHLELGGAYFNYAEQHQLMEAIAVMLDETIKNMPSAQKKDLPKNFSFLKFCNELGFNDVKALGASSHLKNSGLYHSRTFALIPEGRKGLMTLNGGAEEPFLTLQVAPKGTDLALEFPLHLKTVAKETLQRFLELVPDTARPKFQAPLNEPVPMLGINTQELIENLDARLGLFVKVYPEQKLPVPGAEVPIPGLDVMVVADRVGWILEPLKKQFLPMLENPMMPVKVVDENGVLTISFKEPVGPAPADFQPILRFDSKADRLMFATRVSYMEAKDLLTTTPEFQSAWEGMPDQGNAAVYLSPILLKTLQSSAKSGIAISTESTQIKGMMTKLVDFLTPYLNKGQAACMVNLPNGTLGMANMSMPVSNNSALTTLTTMSILSSLAVPTFNMIQVKAKQAKTLKEGRSIHLALQAYQADHQRYPNSLQQLEDDQLLTLTDTSANWRYNATLTVISPSNSIILASEIFPGQTRCVVRMDGSAEVIPEAKFLEEKEDNLLHR